MQCVSSLKPQTLHDTRSSSRSDVQRQSQRNRIGPLHIACCEHRNFMLIAEGRVR